MPEAVQGLFSSASASQTGIKPSQIPSPTDANTGSFQSALDQARPRSTKGTESSDTPAENPAKAQSPSASKKAGNSKAKSPAASTSADDSQASAKPADDARQTAVPAADQSTQTPTDEAQVASYVQKAEKKPATATSTDVNPALAVNSRAAVAAPAPAAQPKASKQTDSGADSTAGAPKGIQASAKTMVKATDVKNPADANADSSAPDAAQTPPAASQPAASAPVTKSELKTSNKGKAASGPDPVDPNATPQGIQAPAQTSQAPIQSAAASTLSDNDSATVGPVDTDPAPKEAQPAQAPATGPTDRNFADVLNGTQQHDAAHSAKAGTAATPAQSIVPTSPEAQFIDNNHPTIVQGIHGQLLPNGGTMQIRLDPPELGALNVMVRVHQGVMTAEFQTSNDQATRALSHSLTQLKSALESQGMNVGKLHVEQTARNSQGQSQGDGQSSNNQDSSDHPAQQEQQRREILRRMWRRLSGSNDPLDMVA